MLVTQSPALSGLTIPAGAEVGVGVGGSGVSVGTGVAVGGSGVAVGSSVGVGAGSEVGVGLGSGT
jgi:hypothetical protein